MATEFKLPEIGEGVVEGEIVEWHVNPGDQVTTDQPLVSVLTDKATIEIAAPHDGVIGSLSAEPGDVIDVGATLLTFADDGAASPPPEPEAAASAADEPAEPAATGAILDFPLPEIGEGVVEGEVVEWLVANGDSVQVDQPIVSVLTDKATIEITAPENGVVLELIGAAGDIIAVGQVIMRLQTAATGQAPASQPAPQTAAPAPATTQAAPVQPAAPANAVDPRDNPSISAFGTPLATPAVRKLAAERGVDLRAVRGSGPNHRILRADLERAIAGKPAAAAPAAAAPQPVAAAPQAAAPQDGETRERIRGLRKVIHASMSRSKQIVPHFTYVDEIEMDKLVEVRAQLKDVAAADGVKMTYLPFLAKAIVFALRKYPILNASVDDEAGEIVYKHYYNIGIATATEAGLTVPVVKEADRKTILQLAREIGEVTDRARRKKSTMDDISGGTFTITSLGRLGGLFATPIINYPEVGILGVHNLQERAVVRNGQIVVRKMMNISLSLDHRVVDGDVGAAFAQEVKGYLEEPSRLLLHMS